MKRLVYLTLFFSLFLTVDVFAQQNENENLLLGKCLSYSVSGNQLIINCENDSKVLLQVINDKIVKVWISPKGDFKRNNESFAVVNEVGDPDIKLNVNDENSAYEVFTNDLRIRINKAPFQLQIFDKYQKMLFGDYQDKGFVKEGKRLISNKVLRHNEQFFGLGEKAGPLNRRGNSYKMWNSDKPGYGVNEDPLYKSIPFFMSSYRYGIFFDNTYKTVFNFGNESKEYYSFEAPDGEMIYYFIGGKDFKEIIGGYTQLTGKPIMPPKWAFGFSQSRGLYTNEQLAREVATEFRARKIPCDIIYQDIGWTNALQDFEWRTGNYSNPRQMVSDLADEGFKMIVSQDPVISQSNDKQWQEANSLGFFVKDVRTGQSYDMPWPWGGNCGVVDFTKPAVADWWGRYQQKPIHDGVKGFWTDMGEPAWSNEESTDRLNMQHFLGMHDEIHNVYGLTWDKIVTEQFEKHNPNQRIFQMTRAAYAGLQRYTFGWSGDAGNTSNVLEGWGQFANQIPISLSAGMGLIPFWATDISGYCGDIEDYDAMAQLYIRWMQFGVFNPLSRAHHEGNNAVEPWMFGAEAEQISRKAIELKYQLFPYIYTYAREAHDTGLPIMRALLLEYPNDTETFNLNGQFLFGKELLVAPVVEEDALTKDVYLPEGEWIDFNDRKNTFKGGQWINYEAPLDITPLFVKKGSIIPMMPIMQYIHEKPNYPVTLEIFPATLNKTASFELYEDEGENNDYKNNVYSKTRFSTLTNKEGYVVTIDKREDRGYQPNGQRNYVLKLNTEKKPKAVSVNAKKVKETKTSTILKDVDLEFEKIYWSWDDRAGVLYIKVPDTGHKIEVTIN